MTIETTVPQALAGHRAKFLEALSSKGPRRVEQGQPGRTRLVALLVAAAWPAEKPGHRVMVKHYGRDAGIGKRITPHVWRHLRHSPRPKPCQPAPRPGSPWTPFAGGDRAVPAANHHRLERGPRQVSSTGTVPGRVRSVDDPQSKWDMNSVKKAKPTPEPKTPGTLAVQRHRLLLNKLSETRRRQLRERAATLLYGHEAPAPGR